jgi:hypothetical protein
MQVVEVDGDAFGKPRARQREALRRQAVDAIARIPGDARPIGTENR